MTKRKFYYSVENTVGGIAYAIAVSKQAAWRQAQRASKKGAYIYNKDTLKRISKAEYIRAHQ